MDSEFLKQLIVSAPNFIGFILLTLVLYKRLVAMDNLAHRLLNDLKECERDNTLQTVKTQHIESS